MELSDQFSFTVPNAHHIESVKNHWWDGKIRLFDMRSGALYYGLHTHVKQYCDKNGYDCIYETPIDAESPFSVDEFNQMVKALHLSATQDGVRVDISPYDYQEHGIIHAIQANRCLLLSPTASGKSLCIYILLRYYLAKTTGKILIIVPTCNLVQQLYEDFQDYATKIKWNTEEFCHLIFEGSERLTDKRVTITTWQALAVKERLPKEQRQRMTKAQIKKWNKTAPYILNEDFFAEFDVVFGDEVHKFSSDKFDGGELMEIMNKMSYAKYRIGTTGTLKDEKIHHLILEGLFGEVYQTITTREMIDTGRAAELFIKCLILQYSDEDRKSMRKKTYQEEMEFIQAHEGRSRFIRNLALSLKENTLVLFAKKEKHGKILFDMIQQSAEGDRKIFYVDGDVETDERNQIRKITENETNAIIVASYQTFSIGMNLRNLHHVIFASPFKSEIQLGQSIGRGLRLSKDKDRMTLYDVVDDLSILNKAKTMTEDNYSLKHFAERLVIYNTEQFDYRQYRIRLD
jgi:superfamily II DNA or RNA helicase